MMTEKDHAPSVEGQVKLVVELGEGMTNKEVMSSCHAKMTLSSS